VAALEPGRLTTIKMSFSGEKGGTRSEQGQRNQQIGARETAGGEKMGHPPPPLENKGRKYVLYARVGYNRWQAQGCAKRGNMTTENKRFISVDEVLSVVLQCTTESCGASLSLPIGSEIDVSRLYLCPNCQRPWLRSGQGQTAEIAVQKCIQEIKALASTLSSPAFGGFSLKLEISFED
jgi:hypothetical protein